MQDFNIDRCIWFPNQLIDGDATECVGLTVCNLTTNKTGIIYDPDFTYAMVFRLQGKEPSTAGVDPFAGMQSAVAYGLLPASADTLPALQYGELYVANWQNYSQTQRDLALQNVRNGVKTLDLDFNSIIARCAVNTEGVGLVMAWYDSFMTPPEDGRLPPPSGATTSHEVAVCGQVTIEGEVRMIIKPHLGKSYGAGGFGSLSMAQFYKCATSAHMFDDSQARWTSLIGIALTKFPFLSDYVSSLIQAPMTSPQTPPNAAPAPLPAQPKKDMLQQFCLAIRDYEGSPGDRNYRNNNPGNCRYSSVGYLAMYGKVGEDSGGFAIFKDYATGFLYLENLVRSKIHLHPDQTILQFMEIYAPSSDNNNPTAYAQNIAHRLGVDINYQMKNLLS